MTVERKVVVGFEDIKAVIFACQKCPTRVSIQPDNVRVPHQCPQCGAQWTPDVIESINSPKMSAQRLCSAISQYRAQQGNGATFTILLEFQAQNDFEDKS